MTEKIKLMRVKLEARYLLFTVCMSVCIYCYYSESTVGIAPNWLSQVIYALLTVNTHM